MSSEPTYPKDAAVGDATKQNETLNMAVTAKEAEQEAQKAGNRTRTIVTGAAIGVGSAALVAALMYANRSRKSDKPDRG
jgi:hypothetical protein